MGVDIFTYRCRIGTFCENGQNKRPRKWKPHKTHTDIAGKSFISVLTIITLIWALSPSQAFIQETYILNNNCTCDTIGFNVSQVQLALTQDVQSHVPIIDVYMTLQMSSYMPLELGNKGTHINYGNQDNVGPPVLASDLPNGLKLTQGNLRSIAPRNGNTKLDQLETILHQPNKDTDILGITDIWLDNKFTDSDIEIGGYVPERVDMRDRYLPFHKDGSGAVLVYISDKLSYTCRDDLETNNVESIWIELTPKNHPSYLICIVYRSQAHSLNDWFQCFSHQLTNDYVECNSVTVLGDFNIDILKSDADSNAWLELIQNYQFSQLSNEPTRVTNKSRTLIDHILTTTPDKVRCTKVPKIGISDHYPSVVVYKDTFRRKHNHSTIKYRSEKNFDKDIFFLI